MQLLKERREDLIAGAVTTGLGLFILVESMSYKLGTIRSMGPGFFPMLLAVAMCALGVLLIVLSEPDTASSDAGTSEFADKRGVLMVTAAFLAFTLLIERAGLVPAVALAVFLAALANRTTRLVTAVLLAVGTALACWLIFSFALGLQIKAFA